MIEHVEYAEPPCDGKCPKIKITVPYFDYRGCCKTCATARRSYLESDPKLKEFWTDELGFWGQYGCKLPRSWYPKECSKYDCRKQVFYLRMEWLGDEGFTTGTIEMPKEQDTQIRLGFRQLQDIAEKIMDKKL